MRDSEIQLPKKFEQGLLRFQQQSGLKLNEPAQLARDVLALSDFYIQHAGASTPWEKPFCKAAYLSYFLPLNTARLLPVMSEVKRFLPSESVSEIWDFGAGLGATQWAFESLDGWNARPLYALEKSRSAANLYRELSTAVGATWKTNFVDKSSPQKNAMAVFSYSFLEMQKELPDLQSFDHLLIVEPSTQDCGRQLMDWRGRLMVAGFQPLAPCTHSEACPLLTKSARDWCHMRVHFSPPEWFSELEAHLPMKNRTLTYSYLLMSKTVRDERWRGSARAIGDTLKENGKTKQMICQGPERQFASWLHKHGTPPHIPHGALIEGLAGAEVKGPELRPLPGALTWTV